MDVKGFWLRTDTLDPALGLYEHPNFMQLELFFVNSDIEGFKVSWT